MLLSTKIKIKLPWKNGYLQSKLFLFLFLLIYLFIYSFFYLYCCSRDIHFLNLDYFSRLHFHVTGTPPWLLKSTSSEFFSDYFIIAYFYHNFLSFNTVGEAPQHLLSSTCVTYEMPEYCSGHQILSDLLPSELLTCLAYLPSKEYQ